MKILIRWQHGSFRVNLSLRDQIPKLVQLIADTLSIDKSKVTLYYDFNYKKPVPESGNLFNAKISDQTILYAWILPPLPDVKFAQMCTPADPQSQYLDKDEQLDSSLRNAASEFSNRTVTPALIEHRESLKPKIFCQEESSCYAFRVADVALQRFRLTDFSSHRLIFLFGRVNKITGKVTAHVGLEPVQINYSDRVDISPNFDITIPIEIASYFGMECVGMAISHPGDMKHPMTSYMVRLAAQYQNMFSEYFTTLSVYPITVKGKPSQAVEAFQVSDAAMRLDSELYFVDPNPSETEVLFKEPLRVYDMKKTQIDVNYLLCAIRVRQTKSKIPIHSFPYPSAVPSLLDLKKHLEDNEYCPSWYYLFDFNLLVFLQTQNIVSSDEMQVIVKNIVDKKDIPDLILRKIHNAVANL